MYIPAYNVLCAIVLSLGTLAHISHNKLYEICAYKPAVINLIASNAVSNERERVEAEKIALHFERLPFTAVEDSELKREKNRPSWKSCTILRR